MSVQRFDICIDYDQKNPIEITEMGEWIKYDDYKKIEQQNKEMLEALIKATKYMQIQRPFMNYSDDVELYENNIKIIESVTGKDIEEIIT